MMRVFKPQSPMSVGAWTLAVFGTFSAAAAFSEMLKQRFDFLPVRLVGDMAEGISALAGLPFSNYTGVLIGASVIPLWNENVASLPIHFGMSGLNSAVSILELLGHDHPALNTLGMGASAIETFEGITHRDQSQAGDGSAEARPQRIDHAPGRRVERPGAACVAGRVGIRGEATLAPASQDRRGVQRCRFHVDALRVDPCRTRFGAQLARAARNPRTGR